MRRLLYVLLGFIVVVSLTACSKPARVSGGGFTVETPSGWTSKTPAVKKGGTVDFVFTRVRKSLPATLTVVLVPGHRSDADLLRRLNKSVAKREQRQVSRASVGPYAGYQWKELTGSETAYQFFGAGPTDSAVILLDSASGDGKDLDMKMFTKVLSSVETATPTAKK